MFECVTKALVLEKIPMGDSDGLLTLYTERLGKVSVKAKSIRKVTSKLSAHTEPGMLSLVRLVGKNPFQKTLGSFWLSDSLGERKLFSDFIFLDSVASLTTEFHSDAELWQFLLRGTPDPKALFALLGFHPHTYA
ncbi:MAG: recombination protein O N-terminal domain-containing protein [bacterium]|nr:recombination protein O N-terminal domain-containing protein [bacterium]